MKSPHWIVKFCVTGKGAFPVDMLRHDDCWPADGHSADNLLTPVGEKALRDVTLYTRRGDCPTVARWNSFGWGCNVISATMVNE